VQIARSFGAATKETEEAKYKARSRRGIEPGLASQNSREPRFGGILLAVSGCGACPPGWWRRQPLDSRTRKDGCDRSRRQQ
jgi:hypothetical protein